MVEITLVEVADAPVGNGGKIVGIELDDLGEISNGEVEFASSKISGSPAKKGVRPLGVEP